MCNDIWFFLFTLVMMCVVGYLMGRFHERWFGILQLQLEADAQEEVRAKHGKI